MLRPCRYNPKLSACTALEGEYSYNHTPIAPLGSKVIAHDHVYGRQSWAPHGHYGCLIGPAKEHHRCFTVYNPKTKGAAIADTLQWSESNRFQVPRTTPIEQLTVAAAELATALKKKHSTFLPDNPMREKINQSCNTFAESTENIILKRLKPIKNETHANPRVHVQKDPTAKPRVISKPVKNSNPQPSPHETSEQIPSSLTPNTDVFSNRFDPQDKHNMPTHQCNTRTRFARAANTLQMEEKQLTNPQPVTFKCASNAVEPSSQLNHESLLKTNDAPV